MENSLWTKNVRTRSDYGAKTYVKTLEVGKWFKFETVNQAVVGYGKVIEILDNGTRCKVEKYFELPSYRPTAEPKWFDKLPYAVCD